MSGGSARRRRSCSCTRSVRKKWGFRFIFGIIIQSGGGWYLGVPEADNESAARACFLAAAIYLGFLVWCGCCVARMNAKKSPPGSEELIDEEAEGLAKV